MSQVRRGTKKTSQRPEVGRPGKNPAGACKPLKRDVHAWQRGQHRQRSCSVPTGAAARANTHPPQRPARRCPTRQPVRNRLFEARASTRVVPTGIEPALSSKLGTQKGGQKRHTRGPQGSLPFRRIRRRRPGTSHEAALTTHQDMAPPDSPAAADDHPAAAARRSSS